VPTIELTDQQLANLHALLDAVGMDSPLDVLDVGGHLHDLKATLPAPTVPASLNPEQLRAAALDWPGKRAAP